MRPKVLILYSLLAVIWGSTWLALKINLRGTPPILGVGLRFGISAVILWIIFLRRGERLTLTATAIKVYLAFGVLNFATSYSLTYWGTQHIHIGVSAILWALLPIFVALLAHFMIADDTLTLKKLLGGATGLFGTVLIFTQEQGALTGFRTIGAAALLVAVLIAAWPNVFFKRHQTEVPHMHLNVAAQTIAAVIMIPLSFAVEDPASFAWNLTNVSALAYLVIFGTLITWSIYLWLFSQLTVTQVSTIALIPPVLASLLGWAILGETFTSRMIVGSVLVLAGVFIVNMQHKSTRPV